MRKCTLHAPVLACLVAAGCGGGSTADTAPSAARIDRTATRPAAATLVSAPLATALDGFAFARPSTAMVSDQDGVWLPLEPNEPGFSGARRVKNLFLWSEDPTRWNLLSDGASSWSFATADFTGTPISVLRVRHAPGQTGAPYVIQPFSGEPGSRLPGLFASRFEMRQTSGTLGLSWTHQGRTHGVAIGSESNSPRTTISLTNGAWQSTSQTLQLFEQHAGWIVQAPKTVLGNEAEFDIARMQFEDVSGFKTQQWSSEYVPSFGMPGVRWFAYRRGTTRTCCSPTNPTYGTFNASNQPVSAGGDLTDGIGPAIEPRGLQIEGEATNLALWSALGAVGAGVLDAASTNYSFVAPATSGSDLVYLDPRSSRLTYRASDIVLVQGLPDRLQATKTDFVLQGWRAGMSVWIFVAESSAGAGNGGVQGPFTIASATQRELTLSSSGLLQSKPAGQFVQVHRIPAVGDWIMVQRNSGVPHYARVASIALPTIPQTPNPDGYQHQSLLVRLSAPLPADGVHGASAGTNNNQPVYWASDADLPVTASMFTTGVPPAFAGKAELAWDRDALVGAGLGFPGYNGLVLKLLGGTQGNTAFDLTAVAGVLGRHTSASVWVRKVSGSGTPALVLKGHPGAVRFTNSEFQRIEWRGTSANSSGTLRILIPPATVVHAFLPQVVQAVAGGTATLSSPVITRDAPATRASSIVTMPLAAPIVDGRLALTFEPSGQTASRQTLYWVSDSTSALEVAASGDAVVAELQRPGSNSIVSAPNPGGTIRVEVELSGGQLRLRVNGVASPLAEAGGSVPAGLQYLGTKAGAQTANGSFRDFSWQLGLGSPHVSR